MVRRLKTAVAGIAIISMFLLSGCDESIAIYRYEFVQPPRVVYIANVDMEIDFTGATLRGVAPEAIYDEFSILEAITFSRATSQGEVIDFLVVEHEVDFSTPGIYRVELIITHNRYSSFSVPFFIQVVDKEIFNQLNNPD